MAYDYPTNLTSLGQFTTYMNSVTLGWFWTIILISWTITVFLFLNSMNKDLSKNAHSTLFSTFILGVILYGGGLITPHVLLFAFLLWGLSAWYVRVDKN